MWGNFKRCNLCMTGILKGEKRMEQKKYLKKSWLLAFQNKDNKSKIQEAQSTLNRIKIKNKALLDMSYSSCRKGKTKEHLERNQREKPLTYGETRLRITPNLSETTQGRREGCEIFKVLKDYQPRILCPVILFFKGGEENKDSENLKR